MSMNKGIVVATHPDDHSVDIVLADGRRLVGVQVATPNGSTRTGTFDMPAVPPKGDKWDITQLTGQDQVALVSWVDGIPVCTGFLFPQINQMTFDDPKLRLERHQSDVVSSIDGAGNIQVDHPCGTYFRVGMEPDQVPIAGTDTDGKLAIDRNTGNRVHVRIGFAGNVLELTMTPHGEVMLECDKSVHFRTKENFNIEAEGDFNFKAGGHVRVEAGEDMKLHSPTGMTFDTPNGHFTNIGTASTDFVATARSLVLHKHPEIMPGPDQTGFPTVSGDSSGPPWVPPDLPSF